MSEETQAPEAAEAAEQQVPSLNVNDLALVANVIDLAVQRGAFKGAEASQVGAIFDKVAGFVNFVAEQQQEEGESEEATEA